MTELTDKDRTSLSTVWPSLPYEDWKDTCATLHLWTQVVGKIRLVQAPMVNHWWQVALYVTSRGLTTSPVPYGPRLFTIDFDFVDHRLIITTSDGRARTLRWSPARSPISTGRSWPGFAPLGLDVRIRTTPVEIPDPIPFENDREHKSYDRNAVNRFWCALAQSHRVLEAFRSRFIGKVSPVNFYWGSFDLAVTRFSGRRAPPHRQRARIRLTRSRTRPIRTRSAAAASGPATAASAKPHSIPMPTPSRPASPMHRSGPRTPPTTATCTSSSCPTTPFASRARPMTICWPLRRARTRRRRIRALEPRRAGAEPVDRVRAAGSTCSAAGP